MCLSACLCAVWFLCERIRVKDTDEKLLISVSTFQARHFIVASLPAGSKSSVVIRCNHQNNHTFLFKSPFSRRAIRQLPPKIVFIQMHQSDEWAFPHRFAKASSHFVAWLILNSVWLAAWCLLCYSKTSFITIYSRTPTPHLLILCNLIPQIICSTLLIFATTFILRENAL